MNPMARNKRELCETWIVTNYGETVVDQYGYFRAREFASPDSSVIFVNKTLTVVLGSLRGRLGKPVYINSGYRTPQHNEKVGGAKNSYHLYGAAADIRAEGYTPKEVYKMLDNILNGWGGLEEHETFVHIDVRDDKWRKPLEQAAGIKKGEHHGTPYDR